MATRLVPNPDATRPGDKDIAVLVHFHAIGHSVVLATRFSTEDSANRDRSVVEVVLTNIALRAVVHVKPFAVRRESKAVRLREFPSEQSHGTVLAEAIDALKRNFLRLALRKIECGIRKIEGTVRAQNNIVRAIETLTVISICKHGVPSIGARNGNDRAKNAGAID